MKRSERLFEASKRELVISVVSGCLIAAVGSQVGWMAHEGLVGRALACVAGVFVLSVIAFACMGNAVRLFRMAREERIWEIREENYSTDGINLEPTQRANGKDPR
jgi:hypothetical protein